MPNWCHNTLNVSGNQNDIEKFKRAARGYHAGYKDSFFDIDTREWPVHDDIRVKAHVKDPAPLGETLYDFCMNALFPVPLDYRRFPFDCNQARKMGDIVGEPRKNGGYSWQSHNWGCKWDVHGDLLQEEETFLQYQFDSPWSPPISFFEKIAPEFPNLTFELEYYEPGMAYAGRNTFQGDHYDEIDLPIEDFVDFDDEE